MSDNNSTRKLGIEWLTKPDGSKWISVELLKWGVEGQRPKWIPSFLDLYRIIRAISQCEDEKYPPPQYAGRGKVASFLKDAVYEADFNALATKYKIPERDGDRVVNTNGARLPRVAPTGESELPTMADPDYARSVHEYLQRGKGSG